MSTLSLIKLGVRLLSRAVRAGVAVRKARRTEDPARQLVHLSTAIRHVEAIRAVYVGLNFTEDKLGEIDAALSELRKRRGIVRLLLILTGADA